MGLRRAELTRGLGVLPREATPNHVRRSFPRQEEEVTDGSMSRGMLGFIEKGIMTSKKMQQAQPETEKEVQDRQL